MCPVLMYLCLLSCVSGSAIKEYTDIEANDYHPNMFDDFKSIVIDHTHNLLKIVIGCSSDAEHEPVGSFKCFGKSRKVSECHALYKQQRQIYTKCKSTCNDMEDVPRMSCLSNLFSKFIMAPTTGLFKCDDVPIETKSLKTEDCGGYYRTDSGEVRHPRNGGEYGNNEDCVWIIETSGSQIELSFENFSTEFDFDNLIIRDGNNSGSPLIGIFSGSSLTPVRTGTGQAYLRFTSDHSLVRGGFTIHWNIVEAEGSSECSCGYVNSYQEIVGGEAVESNVKYPWHVGIFNSRLSPYYFCGGTLISDRYVLTAAHCVSQEVIDGLQVRIGDHLQLTKSDDIEGVTETYSIEKVYIHHLNDVKTFNNDFALLRLSKSLTFNDGFGIRPICLPSNSNNNYTGQLGLSVGWGTLKYGSNIVPNTLREVEMTILSPECRGWSQVTPFMICAFSEGKDTCQGDSGGSLITLENESTEVNSEQPEHYVLVGVTSWGIGCAASTPGVYARVSTALDWIHRFVVTCDKRGIV